MTALPFPFLPVLDPFAYDFYNGRDDNGRGEYDKKYNGHFLFPRFNL